MILADYTLPGADPDLQEPFATRLLKLLDYFGGRVMILSGRRSLAAQQALYDAWVRSGYTNPPTVAVPGTSNHERGLAADLSRYDASLSWGEVHYTAAAFGLIFRLPSEDWHVEPDPSWVEPEPPPPEEPEMQWRILAPAGSAAKFIAPMAPLPDGTLAALYATWLPTGDKVQAFAARGVTELGLAVEDLRNVTLLGPLPTGDVRTWTAADWLAVA